MISLWKEKTKNTFISKKIKSKFVDFDAVFNFADGIAGDHIV